jgi:hypothetical protein
MFHFPLRLIQTCYCKTNLRWKRSLATFGSLHLDVILTEFNWCVPHKLHHISLITLCSQTPATRLPSYSIIKQISSQMFCTMICQVHCIKTINPTGGNTWHITKVLLIEYNPVSMQKRHLVQNYLKVKLLPCTTP